MMIFIGWCIGVAMGVPLGLLITSRLSRRRSDRIDLPWAVVTGGRR
jgi:hypothetical protein